MSPEEFVDALLNLPRLYNPIVSPDGKWVAWTWFGLSPTAQVYVAPTDGSQSPVQMTDNDQETFLTEWTPDSRALLVEHDQDGDERIQIFRVDLDAPLTMHPLTEARPNYFIRGGQLHPNGRWLVYGANIDLATGEEIEPTCVIRHDLESGERITLARPEKGFYVHPRLNKQGTHILYNRGDRHPAGMQMWRVAIDGSGDEEILNSGDDMKVYARWLNDGESIMVLQETATHRKVGIMGPGQTQDDIRWLIDDPARNIERVEVPPIGDHLVVLEVRDAVIAGSLLNPQTEEETLLEAVRGNLKPLAPLGKDWLAVYFHSQQPTDIIRSPLPFTSPGRFQSISRVMGYTPLTAADLAPAEDYRWGAVDELQIQGWLYRAKGEAKGTIVYVHGGPTAHSTDAINPQIQYLVSQGFNVLDPNYRGSTGFGIAFRNAIRETGWGGLEQEDIRRGIETLIKAKIAQPGRVGITGTSYGGYSSWCAITRFPTKTLAASAPICGMTDLVVDYHTTRPDLRPYSEEMLGGKPDDVPDRYRERSPINFVDRIQGELLIVQGMQDPNVTPENVRTVTAALQNHGVEYELLAFEDEGHGIMRKANRRRLYEHLVQFFSRAFDRDAG